MNALDQHVEPIAQSDLMEPIARPDAPAASDLPALPDGPAATNLPARPSDPRLLLHACCGPCAEYPARTLMAEGYVLEGYFFNPNIHPRAEWARRRDNLLQLAAELGFPVTVDPAWDDGPWLAATEPVPQRCAMCYAVRLDAAARLAAERGLPRFTTTLLVSPYQDHEALRRIGKAAAERHGVEFLYRDFRPGFRAGQDQARADGLYRQKYCGCIRSLEESPFREKILKGLEALNTIG